VGNPKGTCDERAGRSGLAISNLLQFASLITLIEDQAARYARCPLTSLPDGLEDAPGDKAIPEAGDPLLGGNLANKGTVGEPGRHPKNLEELADVTAGTLKHQGNEGRNKELGSELVS